MVMKLPLITAAFHVSYMVHTPVPVTPAKGIFSFQHEAEENERGVFFISPK